jgi:hypothetical protein
MDEHTKIKFPAQLYFLLFWEYLTDMGESYTLHAAISSEFSSTWTCDHSAVLVSGSSWRLVGMICGLFADALLAHHLVIYIGRSLIRNWDVDGVAARPFSGLTTSTWLEHVIFSPDRRVFPSSTVTITLACPGFDLPKYPDIAIQRKASDTGHMACTITLWNSLSSWAALDVSDSDQQYYREKLTSIPDGQLVPLIFLSGPPPANAILGVYRGPIHFFLRKFLHSATLLVSKCKTSFPIIDLLGQRSIRFLSYFAKGLEYLHNSKTSIIHGDFKGVSSVAALLCISPESLHNNHL